MNSGKWKFNNTMVDDWQFKRETTFTSESWKRHLSELWAREREAPSFGLFQKQTTLQK